MEHKPYVGATVHYTNLGDKDGKYPPQVQAAIITAIYREEGSPDNLVRVDDGVGTAGDTISDRVDLKIFYTSGFFDVPKVPVRKEEGQRGCWNWMERR